jgi:two-component system, NtrC family, response regulator GlrR
VEASKTVPIAPQLLRVDPTSGALKERRYRASVLTGPNAGREARIEGTVIVGNTADAGLCLDDETVSRYHLELQARPEGVRVRDLGSTNGTFVSGARVTELTVMEETTLRIGKSLVRISLEESEVPAPAFSGSDFHGAAGQSPAMRRLFGVLQRVAATDSTVMMLGETGTGKEVLAHAVHRASPRSAGPMVVVDCGAVAANLVESELFGHVKGAFTGAAGSREGAFTRAHGGTLFLDEVAELPIDLQPKLLRALESGEVKPVGADQPRQVDVRVVAATHRDLDAEMKAGRLRQDLYFRLAVVVVRVPPLRERPEDIGLLVHRFLADQGRGDFELSPALLAKLTEHPWPGNVRELRNVVERVLVGNTDPLEAGGESPRSVGRPDLNRLPFKEAKERLIETFTREYVEALLERCDGNISEAARTAGIARNWVHHLVNKYGLKGAG